MPRKQPVWFILIIRITASLTLVMVWIIRSPAGTSAGFSFHRTCGDCLTGKGLRVLRSCPCPIRVTSGAFSYRVPKDRCSTALILVNLQPRVKYFLFTHSLGNPVSVLFTTVYQRLENACTLLLTEIARPLFTGSKAVYKGQRREPSICDRSPG